MKLFIQIPCFNEESSLLEVLKAIPKNIPGIDTIEVLVINDGSSDSTLEVAQKFGVKHIISNTGNKGLGISFREGLFYAINNGADILVNTDGDNQYPSDQIEDLVKPILEGKADIVIGDRQTKNIEHFSIIKKFFQWLGTKITVLLSGDKNIKDAVSGFRAYNKTAMLEINVTSDFSYVLDTTLQASNKRLKSVTVPIRTNPPVRSSRLFNSIWEHMWKSGIQIIRIYAMYKPLRVFFGLGFLFLVIGLIPLLRFLYRYYILDNGEGMIQSLVIGGVIISISINMFALGFIGELMSKNRNLIEQILKIEKANSNRP